MLNIKTMLLPVLLFSVQGFAAIVQQSPSPSPRAESSSSGFLPPTGTDLESVADSAQLVLAAPSLSGPRVGWVRVSRSCFQALQEALARTNGEDATWESLHWELDVVGYSPGTAELKMPDGRETLHRAWSLARHGEWRVMEDPEYIRRVLEQDQHYGNGVGVAGSVPLNAEMPLHGRVRVIGPVRAEYEAPEDHPLQGGYYVVGVQLDQAQAEALATAVLAMDDAALARLMAMGYSLEESRGALLRSRGSLERAAEELLS